MSKFGFIAHPIDTPSFYSFLGAWGNLARRLPEATVKNITAHFSPYELCSFNKIKSLTGESISGTVAAIPLLPMQIVSMPEDKALNIIEKAIKCCERNRAQLIGLGGFTSVIGNEGEVLSRRVSVPLTSGNTLTAALTLDGIYKAAYLMSVLLEESTIAIIGATGDIGSICTKILSKKAKKLNIAARNEKRLEQFADLVRSYGKAKVEVFKYTTDAIRDADIVLSATSALATIIEPQYLKPGTIVCDVSLPANIAREVALMRNDILVFEGGLAKVRYPEDLRNKKVKTILPGNSVYGCIAETMALTFEKKFVSYSIGRGNITEEKIIEIKNIAQRHGIELADFFCGYKFFTKRDIENIKVAAKEKREEQYVAQR